jgi:hypothetical protein
MADTPDDRITVAQLHGASRRHARRPHPTADQREAAVTELADIAAGRADLLAQAAGITAGAHAGDPDEATYLRAAQLLIDAGADTAQIDYWTGEGRRRAGQAARDRQPR